MENKVEVDIKKGSHLYIEGTSNVNKFKCHYEKLIHFQGFIVAYEAVDQVWQLEEAVLQIESSSFDCGGRNINNDFRDLVKSDQYPKIKIEVCRLFEHHDFLKAQVEISIANHSKSHDIKIFKEEDKSAINYKSTLKLNINDFNLIAPRKMMGLIQVDEEISIHVNLNIEFKD